MKEVQFLYGKNALRKAAILFLLLGIFGLVFGYFVFFVPSDKIYLARGTAAVCIAVLGFGVFLYLTFKKSEAGRVALIINEKGILGATTIPAKAAGLIEWADIEYIESGNTGVMIHLKDPEKYQKRMNHFMAKEGFKTAGKKIIISVLEIDATTDEIMKAIYLFQFESEK